MIRLPLLPAQNTFSYPKEAEKAPPIRYFPIDAILTRAWTSDAHTTAYSVPDMPYRLSRDAVQLEGGVAMVLFIADVDCTLSHASSGGHGAAPAPDAWWLAELDKLDALQVAFHGAFIYRTRGGYRIIYLLPSALVIHTPEEVESWRADYLAWIAALRCRFNIYADPSCHDWQRLYRTPQATRTPHGRPEARETIGSPYQIGTWTCEPTNTERELAKTLAKRLKTSRPRQEERQSHGDAGDGALFHAFKNRGWMGRQIEAGKWSVRCPWEDQHTKGTAFNTSTILWGPGSGEVWGWLHCSHAHCQTHDIRDVLKVFTDDELTRAKKAAGIETAPAQPTHVRRMYRPWLGRQSQKGVHYAS
jgi:hypothetical protein